MTSYKHNLQMRYYVQIVQKKNKAENTILKTGTLKDV